MVEDRWSRLQDLFAAAVELPRSERAHFVARECGDDASLQSELESLLDAEERTPPLLEEPALVVLGAALDEDSADELLDQRVGAHHLDEVLGEGGMAVVYGASRADDELRQRVAIKVMKRGLDTAELLARFRAERQTLAELEHPNIVALLDAGSLPDGRPYVVMERVDGVPIDRYCIDQALPLRRRLELFEQVCAAVQHAHQHLIVHRDLKPSNVLVTRDGTPKLLDFGIAKLLATEPRSHDEVTRRGERAPMTVACASPEQIRGEPVTTISDVYSLGVLLYRLLTDLDPYQPADDHRPVVERAVLEERPKPPSARLEEAHDAALRRRGKALRGDLDVIVLKALAKEPERRYASARELAADLRRSLTGLPIEARADSWLYRGRRFLSRHRLGVAASLVLVAALTAAAIFSYVGMERARRGERIAWRAHADAVYVTDFLASVLEKVGAGELVDEAAVLAVLHDAEARIVRDLGDSPEAEARLSYAVGRVYAKLSHWDKAERHADRALELSRTTRGLAWPDELRNLNLLATVLEARGDPRAIAARRDSLAIYRKRLGEGDARTWLAKLRFAEALTQQGHFTEAEPLARETAQALTDLPDHAAEAAVADALVAEIVARMSSENIP